MRIASSAFTDAQPIPAKYTCDGDGVNPPLQFSQVPESARSLALIMEDPDAPSGTFTHWTMWNIDPSAPGVDEDDVPIGAVQGASSARRPHYYGPCPPSGTHRYYFRLYALDTRLSLPEGADPRVVREAVEHHAIEMDEFHGTYSRGA